MMAYFLWFFYYIITKSISEFFFLYNYMILNTRVSIFLQLIVWNAKTANSQHFFPFSSVFCMLWWLCKITLTSQQSSLRAGHPIRPASGKIFAKSRHKWKQATVCAAEKIKNLSCMFSLMLTRLSFSFFFPLPLFLECDGWSAEGWGPSLEGTQMLEWFLICSLCSVYNLYTFDGNTHLLTGKTSHSSINII